MGKIDGFLNFNRELPKSRNPKERIKDFKEIYEPFPEQKTNEQAARCMDCGIPFCHNGCPLGNIIPEFNDAVYRENWKEAIEILTETNNFPEFTGRICPAPCEASCVLGINKPPVAIEHIEKTIAEKAFELGFIKASPPLNRTGKKVAVIGSGPAGLANANQLNKAGHDVTVFERADQIGGLLRYGIPDFKLEKWVIDRRLTVMKEEGIKFEVNAEIGINVDVSTLEKDFDAIVICTGSTVPRDLPIPGRELEGIHFAMEFLTEQNKNVYKGTPDNVSISAKDKHVIVIGGGDTGSDCIGTSHRHGAKSVLQIELLEKPLDHRTEKDPWPNWPMVVRTSSSHDEGGTREWSLLTKAFGGDNGKVKTITLIDIEWKEKEGRMAFDEIAGSERVVPCDLALLAIGFVTPENSLLEKLGVSANQRGLVDAKRYQTNKPNVFTAGDAHRGQSLVVWAISEGREAAVAVDNYLTGGSKLPSKTGSFLAVK